MNLTNISVKNLFGLFNHEIKINTKENITIIHAPNGHGKTAVLKIISAFFNNKLSEIRIYEFDNIKFDFDDNSFVEISWERTLQYSDESAESSDLFAEKKESREFKLVYRSPDGEIYNWTPIVNREDVKFPMSYVEKAVPGIVRIASRAWQIVATGEVLRIDDVLDRFPEYFPDGFSYTTPKWLKVIQEANTCRLIETQRLINIVNIREVRPYERQEARVQPVVKAYASELKELIGASIKRSAALSESLDRTFPRRLIARLQKAPYDESQLREKLKSLESARERLMAAGIIEDDKESAFVAPEALEDKTIRHVLTIYCDDNRDKLNEHTNLLEQLETFTEIINKRFNYKSIKTHRDHGFMIVDWKNDTLDAELLSSGEQHELVLLYELIFKPTKLILIDEPEISLHVSWQKSFISDLERVLKFSDTSIILATHSPTLVGSRYDLMIPLTGPKFSKKANRKGGKS